MTQSQYTKYLLEHLRLEGRFTARELSPGQVDRVRMVREAALSFARVVAATAPMGLAPGMGVDGTVPYLTAEETDRALEKIEEAVFWANSAIAREVQAGG